MRRRIRRRPKIFRTILIVLVSLIAFYFIGAYIVSEGNYGHNAILDEEVAFEGKYISEYYEPYIEEYKYGLGDNSEARTAWVSIYNAMHYLYLQGLVEEEPVVSDIIRYLDVWGTLAYGKLGTNPLAVSGYLKSKGIEVEMVFNRLLFQDYIETSDAAILYHANMNEAIYRSAEYLSGSGLTVFKYDSSSNDMFGITNTHKDDFMIMFVLNVEGFEGAEE